ncbi:MAG TPA: class I SAM-dependent methyltransferase [Solirubrobacterales bacterium]|nr:class I SAM-dependent methyltransferase [Solirubrobacterales bacterium]
MNTVLENLLSSGQFCHKGQSFPVAHNTSPDICRRYANLIVKQELTHALEIGTLFGFSTLFLADALQQTNGYLDTIDIRHRSRTWSNGQEIEDIHEVAEKFVKEAGLDSRVAFHAGHSNQVLARLVAENRSCDFALIDGSHKFEIALLDFIGVDRMLDVGGYVALDDIGGNISAKEGLSGGPNRVLGAVLATSRYKIDLWSSNVAVFQKMRDV